MHHTVPYCEPLTAATHQVPVYVAMPSCIELRQPTPSAFVPSPSTKPHLHLLHAALSTLMNDIARDTNDFGKYSTVMSLIWGGLDSPGREWRKVFKALNLLEHLIKNGTERVVEDARDHVHRIRMLSDFNYYEGSQDKGSGVREKSKQLLDLLKSNDRIREEREKARALRDKFVGISNRGGGSGMGSSHPYEGFGPQSSGVGYHGSAGTGYHDRGSSGGSYKDRTGSRSEHGGSSTYSHRGTVAHGSYRDEQESPPASPSPPPARKERKKREKNRVEIKIKDTAPTGDVLSGDAFAAPATAPAAAPADDWAAFTSAPAPAAQQPQVAAQRFSSFDTTGVGAGNPTQGNDFGAFATAPTPTFDAFGSGQAAAPPPPTQQQPQPSAVPFDAFGSSQPPAVPLPSSGSGQQQGLSGMTSQPQQQQQPFGGGMPQQQPLHQQQQSFGGMASMAASTPSLAPTSNPAPAPVPAPAPAEDDMFGDFQGPSTSVPATTSEVDPAKSGKNWGGLGLGNLVDLGGLKANEQKKKEKKTQAPGSVSVPGVASGPTSTSSGALVSASAAFADLDGFSTTPQPMGTGPWQQRQQPMHQMHQMGGQMGTAQFGGAIGVQMGGQPMAMGGQPMIVGGLPMTMGGLPMTMGGQPGATGGQQMAMAGGGAPMGIAGQAPMGQGQAQQMNMQQFGSQHVMGNSSQKSNLNRKPYPFSHLSSNHANPGMRPMPPGNQMGQTGQVGGQFGGITGTGQMGQTQQGQQPQQFGAFGNGQPGSLF
ncbi:unnamed protein product [Chrysoparadoxa australica]